MSKIEKHCLKCNLSFFVYPSKKDKIFCSNKCYRSYPKPKGKNSAKYSKTAVNCDYCEKPFEKHPSAIKRTKNNLCSTECRQLWLAKHRKNTTKRITEHCKICNKEVIRTESEFKNRPSENYYCSIKCRNIKLEQGRGGFSSFAKFCNYCKEEFTIDKRNHRKRRFCSKECKIKAFPKGEDHRNFKKELSRDYRSKHRLTHENTTWRTKVFKRDSFTCQICLEHSDKLQAHHLENYSSNKEKRFDVDNGVTLCIKCHKGFHSEYGVVRNNESQFEEFKSSYLIKS